ncbi:uncharacterized protein N0V89_006715 [Didymosphaeria variabile]|uniref:Uncharacterized protein n=1 Tax=Didymosphaeria variabile TaxID=1932322 RepID=A0A9W8XHL8_9PLEO|nr:uncharacterized protein N0V89_006715 [Didymosphaeria variabile]KAJ4351375.1 hypothetical protein N0V89_006715 [Didymosphaeria variabile]
MTDTNTSLSGTLQSSLALTWVGYEPDGETSDSIYETPPPEVRRSPSPLLLPRPDKEASRHGSSSAQHPDKDSISHTIEGMFTILQQMQASFASYTSRNSHQEETQEKKNEHISHLAANTRALQENTRLAEKKNGEEDGEVKRLEDADMQMTETEKVQRLEEANARLDGENQALRNEVDLLRRQNKAVRTELRRNVMLQGRRWIGRDLPR